MGLPQHDSGDPGIIRYHLLIDNADVVLPVQESADQVMDQYGPDDQIGIVPVLLVEAIEHIQQFPVDMLPLSDRHNNRLPLIPRSGRGLIVGKQKIIEGTLDAVVERPPFIRQFHPAVVPDEQPETQLGLKALDIFGQAGGGHIQPFRRLGDVAALHDFEEVLDLLIIQGCSPLSAISLPLLCRFVNTAFHFC